jgi:hypothetical protein
MATKTQGKGPVVARAQSLIAGANKHLANVTQLTLAGQSLTPAQAVEKLQSLVDLRAAVDAAKASTQAKLAAEATNTPALRTFMSAFATYVKAAFQNSPDALADFGIKQKARVPQTVEQKTAAAAKRAATRAARHVMGTKQRLEIQGDVTGVTVTPVVAPKPVTATTPSSPSAPATSGSATAPTGTPHAT